MPICFLLAGCSANGPVYNEAEVKDNLVVYRPSHIVASARPYRVSVGSHPECKLGNGGFFTTNISGQTEISAQAPDEFSTSRITVTPPAYVKIEIKSSTALGNAFGLVGMGVAEAANTTPGPYEMAVVAPEQAKADLKGLNRDCYQTK